MFFSNSQFPQLAAEMRRTNHQNLKSVGKSVKMRANHEKEIESSCFSHLYLTRFKSNGQYVQCVRCPSVQCVHLIVKLMMVIFHFMN